jgi:hypothetical protein
VADRLPRLSAPRSARELFVLLGLRPRLPSLAALLDTIDFTDATPAQIYQVVLRRVPETIALALATSSYSPSVHLRTALESKEFQGNVIKFFLDAFSEKSRHVFIHIPKCAGTDFISHIASLFPTLPVILQSSEWTSAESMLSQIGEIASLLSTTNDLFIHGHFRLEDYILFAGTRFSDKLYTIVRDPVEMVVSQINYIMTRLSLDPNGTSPDTREFLNALQLEEFPLYGNDYEMMDLCIKILQDRNLTRSNLICEHLGSTRDLTAASAIRNIVIYNVEITNTTFYDHWMKQKWGRTSNTRHNKSEEFLSRDDALANFGNVISELIDLDMEIYDIVSFALENSGQLSLKGASLAKALSGSDRYRFDVSTDSYRAITDPNHNLPGTANGASS